MAFRSAGPPAATSDSNPSILEKQLDAILSSYHSFICVRGSYLWWTLKKYSPANDCDRSRHRFDSCPTKTSRLVVEFHIRENRVRIARHEKGNSSSRWQ